MVIDHMLCLFVLGMRMVIYISMLLMKDEDRDNQEKQLRLL